MESAKITNHAFVKGRDGRCDFTWYTAGSGWERERCGNAEDRHEVSPITEEPIAEQTEASKVHDGLKSHESTKRVLYHVVASYQAWRNERSLGVPNEFTDDAIRIGEQHLREVDWFPVDEGWLAEGKDVDRWLTGDQCRPPSSVLEYIDAELKRLREPISDEGTVYIAPWNRKAWRQGVRAAREVTARQLKQIRDAYVVESLTRETETLRLYGPTKDDANA
jgi:hypothetical protein